MISDVTLEKNLLQCEKYAFVFSAAYMCQDQKTFIFKCDDKSVNTVSLIDRFRTLVSFGLISY